MASHPTLQEQVNSLMDKLTCSICNQLFKDPVTLTCGHSFCKTCLENQRGNQCPKCQVPRERDPKVNVVLSEIIQQVNGQGGNESQGASGEVQCDVCSLKAEMSCLVCVSSYCSVHLRKHSHVKWLQCHVLVTPVKDLDKRACPEHGHPLVFYNTKEKVCKCVRCVSSFQDLLFIEEEAKKQKAQIQKLLDDLNNDITYRNIRREKFSHDVRKCKEKLLVFNNIMTVMRETLDNVLQPMLAKQRSLEQNAVNLQDNLMEEVHQIHQAMSQLENISNIEDPAVFLQKYSSNQVRPNLTDSTNVKLDTDLDFARMRTATTQMMENIQQEVEKLTPIENQ